MMRKIYLTVQDSVYGDIKEMKIAYKHNTLSETMRYCFLEQFKRLQKEKFGYKGSNQKINKLEQETEARNKIKDLAKNPENLTEYLRKIGYIDDNEQPDDIPSDRHWISLIEKNEKGIVVYVEKMIEIATGRVISRSERFDLDQLINDLKKENKLIINN